MHPNSSENVLVPSQSKVSIDSPSRSFSHVEYHLPPITTTNVLLFSLPNNKIRSFSSSSSTSSGSAQSRSSSIVSLPPTFCRIPEEMNGQEGPLLFGTRAMSEPNDSIEHSTEQNSISSPTFPAVPLHPSASSNDFFASTTKPLTLSSVLQTVQSPQFNYLRFKLRQYQDIKSLIPEDSILHNTTELYMEIKQFKLTTNLFSISFFTSTDLSCLPSSQNNSFDCHEGSTSILEMSDFLPELKPSFLNTSLFESSRSWSSLSVPSNIVALYQSKKISPSSSFLSQWVSSLQDRYHQYITLQTISQQISSSTFITNPVILSIVKDYLLAFGIDLCDQFFIEFN